MGEEGSATVTPVAADSAKAMAGAAWVCIASPGEKAATWAPWGHSWFLVCFFSFPTDTGLSPIWKSLLGGVILLSLPHRYATGPGPVPAWLLQIWGAGLPLQWLRHLEGGSHSL